MLSSLVLILTITVGGVAATYLISDDEPLLWRLAAGSVIGQCVFGTLIFALSFLLGFGPAAILLALLFSLTPLSVFSKRETFNSLRHDWSKAKGRLQGTNFSKASAFVYYAFFLILFLFFFDRAMIVKDQGIFTGGSQNLGDLPFHLGIIYSFVDGANFPPLNPSFAGAKFAYPFVPDLVTAAFVKLGIGVREAMLAQNVSWAFALLVILERFVLKLVNDRLAAKLAPPLLFFSGGLGFLWFFFDYAAQGKSFFEFLSNLPKDYTLGDQFRWGDSNVVLRWGNSMIALFLTQRSLLLGMPLTLIVLGGLWNIFNAKSLGRQDAKAEFSIFRFPFSIIFIGLIAGLLPLVHLHSLFVLFVVTAFLFFMRPSRWREWLAFGAGVCIVAVPQLIWSITGSATRATEFFQFHFGWDSREMNFLWFWFTNAGLFIPLLLFGIYILFSSPRSRDADEAKEKKRPKKSRPEIGSNSQLSTLNSQLLLFYIPFAFLFVLANVARLAPWEWDNIKVLIYWLVGSSPFVALALAWMWRKSSGLKVAAVACFIILIVSGALDVWRTASGQINYKVFDADAVTIATRIKATTKPDALFLNAPTYNSAVVLSGRRSLMRYPGHLSSHGIDYQQREQDVKQIYRGGPAALGLMEKYGIEYVLVSPEEKNGLAPNEAFFFQFPVVAEVGQYKVYDVRQKRDR